MIILVDVASNMVLGHELTDSENAAATVRLVRRVCGAHGIFDRLYTDNGSAFAGHLVAGGAPHKFRRISRDAARPVPPGACKMLGIEPVFALPGNARAKIGERAFASLSRVVDDRPEFAGAHAGHAPGAAPGRDVRPVPIAEATRVVEREVERHNREAGRRGQGARGRSYEQAFKAGLKGRVKRLPTARQLYLAGLIYTPRAVDRHGRVKVDGWIYGGPGTQDALLAHHGRGQIVVGRNPDDLAAPAIAFDADGRLICEGIEPVAPGAYGSVGGARQAARNGRAVRAALAEADRASDFMGAAELREALAALDAAAPAPEPEPEHRVVAARFGAPLRPRATPAVAEPADDEVPAEFRANMDRALGLRRPGSGAA